MRAGIYTRISDDTEGEGLGVARQEQDCRALCERKEWTVVDVYQDNDRSAFSGKPREHYDRLLCDVKAGVLDVIVCWHPDRLHRSPRELEDFIDLLESIGFTVATVTAGDRDFSTPDGRFMARLEGTIARRESEHKSVRIKRKHKELAESGVAASGLRPFGYEWVKTADGKRAGLKVRADERDLVQEAAGRVLRGESVYAVVGDWTVRQVPTVTGTKWSTKTLKQILVSGRIAGFRDRHGEVVKKGQWDPLVDKATWDQLRVLLLDPARRRTRVARRYLLGQGVLRCGSCGGQLVAAPWRNAAGVLVPRYGCRKERGGCGKLWAPAEPIERIVSDAVIKVLSDPAFVARLSGGLGQDPDVENRQEVAALEGSLSEASTDFYVDKLITRAEFLAVRDAIVPRLDAARAALAAVTKRRPTALLAGLHDLPGQWDGLGLDRQRSLIEMCVESVTITAATRRAVAGYFDESRVEKPVWRL